MKLDDSMGSGAAGALVAAAVVGAACLLLLGCKSSDATAPASGMDGGAPMATTPAASGSAPQPADAAAPAAQGSLPDLATRTKLTLRQGQGGPSQRRCGGIAYEVELDLTTNQWVYGYCAAPSDPDVSDAPLTTKKGRLSKDERGRIEVAYRSVRLQPDPRCPHDAGVLVVELRGGPDGGRSAPSESYACNKPFAPSNDALVRAVLAVVNAVGP